MARAHEHHERQRLGADRYPDTAGNERQRGHEYFSGESADHLEFNDPRQGAQHNRFWQNDERSDARNAHLSGPYRDFGNIGAHSHGQRGDEDDFAGFWNEGRNENHGGHGHHPRHVDPDYHQWRSEQIRNLDREYDEYRQERFKKFATDFDKWRSERSSRPQPDVENPAGSHAQPQSHSQDGQPSPLLAGRLDSGVKK